MSRVIGRGLRHVGIVIFKGSFRGLLATIFSFSAIVLIMPTAHALSVSCDPTIEDPRDCIKRATQDLPSLPPIPNPVVSDTGEAAVPLSQGDVLSLIEVYDARLQQKLAAFATLYGGRVAMEDLEFAALPGMVTDGLPIAGMFTGESALQEADNVYEMAPDPGGGSSSSTRYITSIPSHPQEKNYYCGPATVEQILDFLGTSPSQRTLASGTYLDTERYRATYFPRIKTVLNRIRPNQRGGPWLRQEVQTTSDIVNRLDWGYRYSFPGAYNVLFQERHFRYLAYDHGGHIQTSAGWKRVGKKNWGGIMEPYNEASWRYGGAQTAGFKEVRIWRILAATKANPASGPDLIW